MTPESCSRDILEEFQEQHYQNLGLSPPGPQDLGLLIKEHVQRWASLNLGTDAREKETYQRRKVEEIEALLKESPPTRYDDLATYLNILSLARHLEDSAQQSADALVLKRPIFGTVPSGAVNALLLPGGTEYIVVFPSGLFAFAALMGRSVARTLQYSGVSQGILPHAPLQSFYGFSFADEIRESLRHDAEGAKCFTEALLSYVRFGLPEASAMPELDPARDFLASLVYRFFLEFVIAHEYGHILRNHLMGLAAPDVPEGASAARRIIWDWRHECEADVAGCALMLAGARKRVTNLAAVLMGIEVFLSCYEMIDRAVSMLTVGDEEHQATTTTHPPARARRAFLHRHLLAHCHEILEGPDAEAQMRSALKDATAFSRVATVLWEQARPCLWRLYELGCDPAPILERVSDARAPGDPAMLGEMRGVLQGLFPDLEETLERAEALVRSGKGLLRASAKALFKEGSRTGMNQAGIDEAHADIGTAVKGVGESLVLAARALSDLRPVLTRVAALAAADPFQNAVDTITLAGARLRSAGLSKAEATVFHEGGTLIQEAGRLLGSVGEMSGVSEHLRRMGEWLGLGSEALVRDKLKACWKATKLAGSMAVLSGECLIRGVVELWRVELLPMIGGVLCSTAAALRQDSAPHLGMLRDVLHLYKEAGYALLSSLRRSAAFFQNVDLPSPEEELSFRNAANVLRTRANVVGNVLGFIAEAESVFDGASPAGGAQSSIVGTGQVLMSAGRALGEAVVKEQELGLQTVLAHIARALSLAGSQLANRNPVFAARLMEELGTKLLQARPHAG